MNYYRNYFIPIQTRNREVFLKKILWKQKSPKLVLKNKSTVSRIVFKWFINILVLNKCLYERP